MDNKKTLILIDGHALAYRMFFALERTGMKTSKNQPTWAIYGFIKSIIEILKKVHADAIAVSFDMSRKTFRSEEYEEYKAQRAAMPDALREQMQAIIDSVKAFNIPVYMKEGFEADDIIGTIATKAKELGHRSYILTGDQDSFQLIDREECIKVLIPYKNELLEYDCQKVFQKLGVYPEQIIDYKALRGDTADNIPGVKGIGEKIAVKLLTEYKTLDNIYANIDNVYSKNIKEKLEKDKQMAYKSQFLATIKKDVEIDFDFDGAKLDLPNPEVLQEFLAKYEFYSFLKGLPDILKLFNCEYQQPLEEVIDTSINNQEQEVTQLSLFSVKNLEPVQNSVPVVIKEPKNKYEKKLIDSKEKLDELLKTLSAQKVLGMIFASVETDVLAARCEAIAFVYGDAFVVENNRLVIDNDNPNIITAFVPIEQQGKTYFQPEWLMSQLQPILENANIAKITHNAKSVLHILQNYGITLQNLIFDTMVADYVKDPALKHNLKQQALSYLHFEMRDAQELLGKGKFAIPISNVEIEKVFDYFSDDAYALYRLAYYHCKNLDEKEQNLFYQIELPLVQVLYQMERDGVSLDTNYLNILALNLDEQICSLESRIFELAGVSFNINSPRQVGEILFEKLCIKPKGRNKTKTGYSTSADVLEDLAKDYEIAQLLLEHRHLSKIKSTYVDALPQLISPCDNRIHTTFNQTVTTTGRLSSSNPNLQNIPTRTQVGNQIRAAFVPENSNNVILAADYSQVELRVLAHYSQDTVLIEAFKQNEDIHTITASKIFNVAQTDVTKEMRRKAKAVNFGIVYGQSRYGLAEVLSITPAQAQEFMDKYFETYPLIKKYMEETIYFAEKNQYVETLYGRKRYFFNDLKSSNRNIREFAQRAAINAPLQGTAADLIKLAMINLKKLIEEYRLDAKIILQVHDELVLEVAQKDVLKASELTIKAMELGQPLDVPLVVDMNFGSTWKEAKESDSLKVEEKN